MQELYCTCFPECVVEAWFLIKKFWKVGRKKVPDWHGFPSGTWFLESCWVLRSGSNRIGLEKPDRAKCRIGKSVGSGSGRDSTGLRAESGRGQIGQGESRRVPDRWNYYRKTQKNSNPCTITTKWPKSKTKWVFRFDFKQKSKKSSEQFFIQNIIAPTKNFSDLAGKWSSGMYFSD